MIINQIINMETESTLTGGQPPLPVPIQGRGHDLEKNTKICRIIFNTIEATAETGERG